MSATARPVTSSIADRLAALVASVLRVPSALVTADAPFTMLGMDSLGAVELTAAIGDAFGVELGPNAVYEHPDVASLARFIEDGAPAHPAPEVVARMRRDAILPSDIAPSGGARVRTADARHVLLTGATGFLGAYVARTLLDETPATVHCLVRGPGDVATDRVHRNLARYGLWRSGDERRLRIVRGDLARPLLGLTPDEFAGLAGTVDAIYHGAASVNWVHGYDALRAPNVLGTRELLRLACAGPAIPFHFVSSLGVCYSTRGPRVVDEDVDMLPAIDGLHLGYAQSKCVAESLVRAAAARGLTATITRPALVTGDARTGRSNTDDLVSRFIAGCIRLGAAPDLDWRMDCVPVDHVARAVVHLAAAHEEGLAMAHLASPRARHWRECVLWMRLCGYQLELVRYREWLGLLRAMTDTANPLHGLRSFFLQEVACEDHLTLPELYEEPRRSSSADDATRRRLTAVGDDCPAVDAHVLDRYFADFVANELVPHTPGRRWTRGTSEASSVPALDDLFPQIAESLGIRFDDPTLRVESATVAPLDTDDSIVAELTSWRHGTSAGLYRASLTVAGRASTSARISAIVKVKPADEHVLDVAESVAALAGPALGETYSRFRDWVGFGRSHLRELALYAHPDPRLRRHSPAPLALERDDSARRWILVLEDVPEAAQGGMDNPSLWSADRLDAALCGLAQVHAVWFERDSELLAEPWLAPPRDAARLVQMTPLWSTLAQHARARSPAWRRADVCELHDRLANDVAAWAEPAAGLSRTLIHNDFNPRNLTIREASNRLCAWDWELATLGLPQRDVAELLCFTLPPSASPADIARWVERSSALLAQATGRRIDPAEWILGLQSALAELMVDRLAMYAMVDRFRRQRFLPRVVASWMTVYQTLAA